jgi:hypothetical protein
MGKLRQNGNIQRLGCCTRMQTRIWSKNITTTNGITIAGDQVPDIPFGEVGPKMGRRTKTDGAIGLKLGVVESTTRHTTSYHRAITRICSMCATVKVTD